MRLVLLLGPLFQSLLWPGLYAERQVSPFLAGSRKSSIRASISFCSSSSSTLLSLQERAGPGQRAGKCPELNKTNSETDRDGLALLCFPPSRCGDSCFNELLFGSITMAWAGRDFKRRCPEPSSGLFPPLIKLISINTAGIRW